MSSFVDLFGDNKVVYVRLVLKTKLVNKKIFF